MGMLKRNIILVAVGATLLPTLACGGAESEASARGSCGALRVWDLPEDELLPLPGESNAAIASEYRTNVTKARLNLVALATERYCELNGSYPTDYQDLMAPSDMAVYPSCTLSDSSLIHDAWDHQIRFQDNERPHVVSAGPDGTFGTADDIQLPSGGTGLQITLEEDCPPLR